MKDKPMVFDLEYVLYSVLKKWKLFVLTAFVSVLLGALWGVANPFNGILSIKNLEKAASEAQAAYEAGDEKAYDSLIYSIVEKQIKGLEVKDVDAQKVELYARLRDNYYTEKSRAERSYIMQIDEKEYYEGIARIYFECDATDAFNYCMKMFDARIARNKVRERMAEAAGAEGDMESFTYSVPYDFWHDSLDETISSISVSNELDNAFKDLKITKNMEDGIIITCSTMAATEEVAQALLQVGIEEIEGILAELKTEGYNFKHEVFLREIKKVNNGSLKARKDDINTAIQKEYDEVLEYRKKLTQAELDYYSGYYSVIHESDGMVEAKYSKYDGYSPDACMRQNQVNGLIENQKEGILVSLLKTMIIFGMLGIVVCGAVCVLQAVGISTETFVLPEDIERCCGAKVLACIHEGSMRAPSKFFDDFRDSGEYAGEMLALMGRRLVLAGDTKDTLVRQSMTSIADQCENVECGDPIADSVETLNKAKKSDGVVLMVVSEKTRRADVMREWKACELQGIPVRGIIMLR